MITTTLDDPGYAQAKTLLEHIFGADAPAHYVRGRVTSFIDRYLINRFGYTGRDDDDAGDMTMSVPHTVSVRAVSTPAAPPDPDARYRQEYRSGAAIHKWSCSEADYLRTRRIDDGLEALVPSEPAQPQPKFRDPMIGNGTTPFSVGSEYIFAPSHMSFGGEVGQFVATGN